MPAADTRPRILLITRNLPPLVGGMERLMQHLACGMAEYADLTVIGPRGCAQSLPVNVQVYETSDKLATFLLHSTWLGIKVCRRTKFDIVMGGSGLIAPTLRILAALLGCKTAVYLHGLDLVVDNFWFQRVFVPCMHGIDLAIVNSRSTRDIARNKGLSEKQITIVNPGTEIPDLPSAAELARFRAKHNIEFEKIIVFVGRMTRRKGLSAFIANCLPQILSKEPRAGLVIVGKNPEQSLNQSGEESDVLAAVEKSGFRDRIAFLGQLDDSDLRICYATADVQVLPLVNIRGDIEGFGMVAIEAAALGVPTVAFSLGGVTDAISPASGILVPEGNYALYAEAVTNILAKTTMSPKACREHAESFSWGVINGRFRKALATVMSHPT